MVGAYVKAVGIYGMSTVKNKYLIKINFDIKGTPYRLVKTAELLLALVAMVCR